MKLTSDEKLEIIKLYQSNIGSDTIAKKFNVAPTTILKILKKHNIERRGPRKKIFPEDEPKIVSMYQEGLSAPEIAIKFDVSHSMILKYLEKNNIDRRSAEECHRIYPIHEDFFDNIDTEEKAYFLGFLYADGGNNIDANFIRIDLARKDRDILEKLSALIYLENTNYQVKDYEREKKKPDGSIKIMHGSYLNINSKYICNKLYDLGCENKKSLILKFPQWLNDTNLQRHFIRGYFDGDGGLQLTDIKTRGANLTIISTLDFCEHTSNIILQQTELKFGKPSNCLEEKDVYTICLSGNRQIAKFLNWLYKDSTIYLDRKYKLYQKLLEKNNKTDEFIAEGTQGYSKRYYQKYKNDFVD